MSTALEQAAYYDIEPALSTFRIHVKASGMLSAFGHNPTIAVRIFSGEAKFNAAEPAASSLKVVLKAASLRVVDNMKDGDRDEIEKTMREQVLEAEQYPQIAFTSNSVALDSGAGGNYKVTMEGQLTLHGITRDITIPAQVSLLGEMLNAAGEFTLRQTDFGIRPVSAVGGGLKVKDEVKVAFHFVCRKRLPQPVD